MPRWVTTFQVLDYYTYIGADKFENIYVCRMPFTKDEEIDENPRVYQLKWETGTMSGA